MSEPKWEEGPWVALPSRVRFCRWQDETPRFDDGLWHILPAGQLDRLPICAVDHGNDHYAPTREKAKHTAWLVAAAPSLYEALDRASTLLGAIVRYMEDNPIAAEYTTIYDDAECDGSCLAEDSKVALMEACAALAKAQGKDRL